MLPYSRGKRILELSLKSQNTSKYPKLAAKSTQDEAAKHSEDVDDCSLLDISNSQLFNIPDALDISFSVDECVSVSELPLLSSKLKVASFILNENANPESSIAENNEGFSTHKFDRDHVQSLKNANVLIEKDEIQPVNPEARDTNYVESDRTDGEALDAENIESHRIDGEALDANNVESDKMEREALDAINVESHRMEGEALDANNVESHRIDGEALDANNVESDRMEGEALDSNNVETDRMEGEALDAINVESDRMEGEALDANNVESDRLEGSKSTEEVFVIEETPNVDISLEGITQTILQITKKTEKKKNRQHGKPYIGRHFDKAEKKFIEVIKEGKILGERCNCKAAYYRCKELSDADRQKIHSDIWQMSWNEKAVFVRTSVEARDVKERRGKSDVSRRNKSLFFTLLTSNGRLRVCKEMYLNTTGLGSWWVLNTVSGENGTEALDIVQGTGARKSKGPSVGVLFIQKFMDRLPKMPSHYCRKDISKIYLEPMFKSYADIYREYSKVCETENFTKMSMTVFMEELKAKNISVFIPRKDQCDLCCEYEQGNKDENVYQIHRTRKEAAQKEKAKDKHQPEDSRVKVFCMDVQRVLLSPCIKASTLYYKTKLQIHNYTMYDLASRDVSCYVWNESEGALTANEFASCLFKYLEENKESFDKAIIYSDGCTYQNRNRVLATALRYFCVKYNKVVEQKILERGHTQMEVDSVHATIERRLKNADIYSPLNYVQLMKAARTNPKPYDVKYLSHDFFLDFDKYGEGDVKSLKPGKDANVTNLCALRYAANGSIAFKLNFSDDWQQLNLGRHNKLPTTTPSSLYDSRRKIKKSKFDHLQSMKPVLPRDVYSFYDSLPHS